MTSVFAASLHESIRPTLSQFLKFIKFPRSSANNNDRKYRDYSEEQVRKGFEMAAEAIQQKNLVICMLQEKLQNTEENLELARLQKQVESLTERLVSVEEQSIGMQNELADKDSTISELAQLLASSEANQAALISTVHAYIHQQVPSLPATPRGGPEDISNPEIAAERFETMISFMQQRIQQQAVESPRDEDISVAIDSQHLHCFDSEDDHEEEEEEMEKSDIDDHVPYSSSTSSTRSGRSCEEDNEAISPPQCSTPLHASNPREKLTENISEEKNNTSLAPLTPSNSNL